MPAWNPHAVAPPSSYHDVAVLAVTGECESHLLAAGVAGAVVELEVPVGARARRGERLPTVPGACLELDDPPGLAREEPPAHVEGLTGERVDRTHR
jgi:hypothetical protein